MEFVTGGQNSIRLAARKLEGQDVLPTTNQLTKAGILALACVLSLPAEEPPVFHVNVDMVVFTFTVTDAKGNYVRGLKADDVRVREDGVDQKIVAFAEGTNSTVRLADLSSTDLTGSRVFVLFDTSNWMYTGFAYASDAITDFVRRLDSSDSVAVYSFSRNLFRAVRLTRDRSQALSGIRRVVAGDQTALYNSLLLTLRDAAKVAGRKTIVVFSNGPDDASIVAPDDVGAVAEDEGIPIYIVSTDNAERDEISANVFRRLSKRTGGQLFWTHNWQHQAEALDSIHRDVASSYTIAYYPLPNSNEGFRSISVNVLSDRAGKYRIRTRLGYHASRSHP